MLHILDEYLPVEISDMIFKKIKNKFMEDLKNILENKTVFTISKEGKLSFLILENNINYYAVLENLNDEEYINVEKGKKKYFKNKKYI